MCCISARPGRDPFPSPPPARSRVRAPLGHPCHLRAARGAGLLHPGGHRDVLRYRLGDSLQLQPHRRAPGRAQAAMGARRWRRGGPAPLQYPRQRLCDRHRRFHRRHAGHPRAGWPEPGRLRVPCNHHRADLWKIGQVRPGDTVRFVPVSLAEANRLESEQESAIRDLRPVKGRADPPESPPRYSGSERANGHPRGGDLPAGRATSTCWSNTARSCSTSILALSRAGAAGMAPRAGDRGHRRDDAGRAQPADPLRTPCSFPPSGC